MENECWPKYGRPFYFHFYNKKDNKNYNDLTNGVTVCAIPEDVGSGSFYIDMAITSPEDNFSKRIGRAISEGRARSYKKKKTARNFEELKCLIESMVDEKLEEKAKSQNDR